ncbi:iron-sulfur cluster assembly scaffold protein [Thalassotalea atypica]|uniref:iron-sulfur cluster assembly scaffold protein n=1 Tax=Thalassotalea atypica TaxID=2054316 RepID=UPI0025741069|nr:iron-sulfur cluster assembly scaffold protein [Thalassotalea atypica]
MLQTNSNNSVEPLAISKLYHQALLRHHKKPIGFDVTLSGKQVRSADGENPECGDEITVNAKLESGAISNIVFSGESCAICRASASMMCEKLVSMTTKQALAVINDVEQSFNEQKLFEGNLSPLNSVFSLPIRQQCALLPWRTAVQVLEAGG